MTLLLFIGSVVFALAGLIVFAASRGAIHETAAFVLFLTSAVMLVGATLNNAANRIIDVLRERLAPPPRIAKPATGQPDKENTPPIIETPVPAFRETPQELQPATSRSWVEEAKAEIEAEKT